MCQYNVSCALGLCTFFFYRLCHYQYLHTLVLDWNSVSVSTLSPSIVSDQEKIILDHHNCGSQLALMSHLPQSFRAALHVFCHFSCCSKSFIALLIQATETFFSCDQKKATAMHKLDTTTSKRLQFIKVHILEYQTFNFCYLLNVSINTFLHLPVFEQTWVPFLQNFVTSTVRSKLITSLTLLPLTHSFILQSTRWVKCLYQGCDNSSGGSLD